MVDEWEARSRYTAYTEEIRRLEAEIGALRMQVRAGSERWRADLEQLAERGERRRVVAAQLQALGWVLGGAAPGGREDMPFAGGSVLSGEG